MRAVNLMPESGGRGVSTPAQLLNPAYGVIALLVVVLALVSVYVLSANSVSSRQAKLASLQREAQIAQSQANQLTNYVAYQKIAQQRVTTVRQIAAGRFDWYAALTNLSRVVPANAAFQSLLATAAPGASVVGAGGSAGGAGTGSLRSTIQGPAFEVKGCTDSHDDVARLLSRLRAMPGVQRVTLADSVKNEGSTTAGSPAPGQVPTACGRTPASFDLVVFFTPLAGAPAPAGAPGAAPVSTPAGAASAASSATTTTATTTTGTATAQPVSSGSGR